MKLKAILRTAKTNPAALAKAQVDALVTVNSTLAQPPQIPTSTTTPTDIVDPSTRSSTAFSPATIVRACTSTPKDIVDHSTRSSITSSPATIVRASTTTSTDIVDPSTRSSTASSPTTIVRTNSDSTNEPSPDQAHHDKPKRPKLLRKLASGNQVTQSMPDLRSDLWSSTSTIDVTDGSHTVVDTDETSEVDQPFAKIETPVNTSVPFKLNPWAKEFIPEPAPHQSDSFVLPDRAQKPFGLPDHDHHHQQPTPQNNSHSITNYHQVQSPHDYSQFNNHPYFHQDPYEGHYYNNHYNNNVSFPYNKTSTPTSYHHDNVYQPNTTATNFQHTHTNYHYPPHQHQTETLGTVPPPGAKHATFITPPPLPMFVLDAFGNQVFVGIAYAYTLPHSFPDVFFQDKVQFEY
ncbi:hypothetical protein HDU76_005540 [Blyttiomyces sp. JEL0837]|nr:hypothetical protein HDU76_005540 [Blyttiomyces sp. JEL0837]